MIRWVGNAEISTEIAQYPPFQEFAARGMIRIFFADYRGYGWSDGDPSLASFRNDADHLYRALPELLKLHGATSQRMGPIIVSGRSIGAHCALHVATMHADEVAALILDSPASCHWPLADVPGDLWSRLGQCLPQLQAAQRSCYCDCCKPGALTREVREAMWLDSLDLLRCIDMPLLVQCGTVDPFCPVQQIEEIVEAAAAKLKQLVWIEGRGHNDCITKKYWQALECFLESVVEGVS